MKIVLKFSKRAFSGLRWALLALFVILVTLAVFAMRVFFTIPAEDMPIMGWVFITSSFLGILMFFWMVDVLNKKFSTGREMNDPSDCYGKVFRGKETQTPWVNSV